MKSGSTISVFRRLEVTECPDSFRLCQGHDFLGESAVILRAGLGAIVLEYSPAPGLGLIKVDVHPDDGIEDRNATPTEEGLQFFFIGPEGCGTGVVFGQEDT